MFRVFNYQISKLRIDNLSAILKQIENIKILHTNTIPMRERGESLNKHLTAYR